MTLLVLDITLWEGKSSRFGRLLDVCFWSSSRLGPGMRSSLALGEIADQDIENRREKNPKYRHAEHPAKDAGPKSRAHFRTRTGP